MTTLLSAPAPVTVVRQRAGVVELIDDALREALGRDCLRVYCTEAIETALRTDALATADGRPVIWAYQPTRAATPPAIDADVPLNVLVPNPGFEVCSKIGRDFHIAIQLDNQAVEFTREAKADVEVLIEGRLDVEGIVCGNLRAPAGS